jgi:hypothetical protein
MVDASALQKFDIGIIIIIAHYIHIFSRIYEYRVCHLKRNPKIITYSGTKIKLEAGPPPCNTLPTTPMTF